MSWPSVYARTWAEIITSPNVGGRHLRRVGELLIAHQELNARFLDQDKEKIPDDVFDEILEKAAELGDAYVEIWRACGNGTQEWRHTEGLAALDEALRRAAEYYRHTSLTV
ncbi:hypothetical protein ACWCPF_06235 [Streptomyces sp. NPDC001858]